MLLPTSLQYLWNMNPSISFEITETGSEEICVSSDELPERVFLHSILQVLSDLGPAYVHGSGVREVIRVECWGEKKKKINIQ